MLNSYKISQKIAEPKRFLRFNVVLLLTILGGCLAVMVFNHQIDPYGMFGSPAIVNISEFRTEKTNHSRLFKAADVIRQKPKTILLGTSTVDFGLDASHPLLSAYSPAYNLALLGANTYEMLHYFKHALRNQPDLKRVIIGLDFTSFQKTNLNKVDYNENRLEITSLSLRDLISTFSIDTTLASLRTIQSNLKDAPYQPYSLDGNRSDKQFSEDGSRLYIFMRTLTRILEARIQKLDRYIGCFKEIIELCRAKNIEFRVFITPIHSTVAEAYYLTNQMSEIENIQREIVKITPIWDFSGFNSITTEPISEQMQNYLDGMHYRKKIGDLIIKRILQDQDKSVPSDFGHLTTVENLEPYLIASRQRWLNWQRENPKLVKLVSSLKHVKGL